ncbi:MAG: Crp/Fnr family transcriptional regulator [Phycisphaerales bacterium]|nr:MAG: Crp/Fnr family transcriptional regulator [Phycisphaerales bacterium]
MESGAVTIIRNCGLFCGLSEASFAKIAEIARIVRFKRGQMIFREGDPCPGIYVVGEGAVRIFKLAPNGKEHVLHFAYPGATFAEVAAIGRFNCPAFADATEDSVCALVPEAGFRRIADEDHAFCIEMMTGMAKWVHTLVGLLEDLVLRDATSRVARHLIQSDSSEGQAEFTLPMRKKDLASHLNLTSETLSRTLHRLVECGLIETREQRIRICELPKLQDVADGLAPAEFA